MVPQIRATGSGGTTGVRARTAVAAAKALRTARTAGKTARAACAQVAVTRATGAARMPGIDGIARTRGTAGTGRTDRRQVSPRWRFLVVAVRAVRPGQPTRRRELLLGHGAPPGSGYGTYWRDTRNLEPVSVIQNRLASTGLLSPCERSVHVRVGEDPGVDLNNANH